MIAHADWRSVECKGVTWLVTRDGRVKSPAVDVPCGGGRHLHYKERLLNVHMGGRGYLRVISTRGGKRAIAMIHRLVAMAFCKGYEPHLVVNHIDGDKLNNSPENLEWVSQSRNVQLAHETGLVDQRGSKSVCAKLTGRQVAHIRRALHEGASITALARTVGVTYNLIKGIKEGTRWRFEGLAVMPYL